MIKLTLAQLTNAAGSGGLARFFGCELTLPAWKALRHTSDAADKEVQAFAKKRDAMIALYEGKAKNGGTSLDFTDPEKAKAFGAEFEALLTCEVELPGQAISIDDVRAGSLTAADHVLLRPFFLEEK